MPVRAFEGKAPQIGPETYVDPSADVIGDIVLGRGCWIGPGARLRGDYGTIRVGDFTAVEDNVVVHARPGEVATIGSWVTLGHGCVVHNPTLIEDYAVVGMGAVVSDWAVVGRWAVVGEGAVVRQRQEIPAEHIAVGVPARLLEKTIDAAYRAEWTRFKEEYVGLARRYARAGFDRGRDGGEALRPTADDLAAIEEILENWRRGWAERDARLATKDYADDADWVNAFGVQRHGREAIEGFLRRAFAAPESARGRPSASGSAPAVRLLTPDVVLVRTTYEIHGQRAPTGEELGPRRGHQLRVLVRHDGRWVIASHVIMDVKEAPSARRAGDEAPRGVG